MLYKLERQKKSETATCRRLWNRSLADRHVSLGVPVSLGLQAGPSTDWYSLDLMYSTPHNKNAALQRG